MITLYDFPNPTRATRVLWTLHELDMDYELSIINPMAGENRTPEYLAINPYGKVPSITHQGQNYTESLAIMEYLNDLHPDKPLTPNPNHADYAQHNFKFRQVLSYGVAEVENYTWLLSQATILKALYDCPEGMAEYAFSSLNKAMPTVFEWLEQRRYIAGDGFTLSDIYYHQLLGWVKMLGVELPEHVQAYRQKLTEREKFPQQLKSSKNN